MPSPETDRKRKTAEEDTEKDDAASPPAKKKYQSTTNKNKVASFFTPVSEKERNRTTWRTVSDSLLVARYQAAGQSDVKRRRQKRRRVAAFDLDSTIIKTMSGKKFGRDSADWKWWHPCMLGELKRLDGDGYQVVILSNQDGLSLSSNSKSAKTDAKRVSEFKSKVSAVLSQLEFPISVYAATAKDHFRKPRVGMWKEMLEDYDLDVGDGPDLRECFFVGDAGGRISERPDKKSDDFSSSDRDFAANIGLEFKTPEEFFLKERARRFKRTFDPAVYVQPQHAVMLAQNTQFTKRYNCELALLCGSPGSGKSTFFWRHLAPLGYQRVNQDILRTRDKCLKKASELLSEAKSVVVDNTNAGMETRAQWIALGRQHNIPVRCVYLKANAKLCEHNDTVRALGGALMNPEDRKMLPKLAFMGFASRFEEPTVGEGFEDVTVVDFVFTGTEEERAVWSKFWI